MLINKLKDYVSSGQDYYEIARWLLNIYIHKKVPLSIDDLPDTSIVAEEIEGIVDALKSDDYEGAINIAEDGASNILEDEGFEI